MPFVAAAKLSELPRGTIREVQIGGKSIALANLEGKVYGIDSVCIHRGGPLGEGELTGKLVTCPWHGWQYDVTTGKVAQSPNMAVACYPTEVRGDEILVDLG
jgi:nitrite reductase (NADH) small subunit